MKRDDPGVLEPSQADAPSRPWSAAWTAAGVIRVLEPMVVDARQRRIREVIAQRLDSVTVLMDAPHDPHNGAAVLRSADAFGVQQVHVVPREEEFLVSTGVAKGTERWVDVIEHPTPPIATERLTAAGYELVATHPQGELVPRDLRGLERVCLVLGNEHDGICEQLEAAATRSVRIPMRGFVESLNVSVSAAILLHAATEGRAGDLDSTQRLELYAQGLYRTVTRADEILGAVDPE